MPIETLRIVPSEEEASLHPRAIWNYWRKSVIWDHRSYYAVLEFIGLFSLIMSFSDLKRGAMGALILCTVAVLHWYANQRGSTDIMTRASMHIAVLSVLALIVLAFDVMIVIEDIKCEDQQDQCLPRFSTSRDLEKAQARAATTPLLILAFPILVMAIVVILVAMRNPPKDPLLAELPSPTDDTYRPVWSNANVADGIEDDSLEPEGAVALGDELPRDDTHDTRPKGPITLE